MGSQSAIQGIRSAEDADLARVASARRLHGLILAGALLVPVLGAGMSFEPGGRVSLPGMGGSPLPHFCVSRQFGFECATCGVTRSIMALVQGDWGASLRYHRFGWLMALLIFIQIPYRTFRILRPAKRLPGLEACGLALLALTLFLILGNWLLGLIGVL